MANLAKKIDAERRMRELLASGGLPAPDAVEYGHACIRLFFEDTKTVVVIDLDDEYGGFDEPDQPGELDEPGEARAPGRSPPRDDPLR